MSEVVTLVFVIDKKYLKVWGKLKTKLSTEKDYSTTNKMETLE